MEEEREKRTGMMTISSGTSHGKTTEKPEVKTEEQEQEHRRLRRINRLKKPPVPHFEFTKPKSLTELQRKREKENQVFRTKRKSGAISLEKKKLKEIRTFMQQKRQQRESKMKTQKLVDFNIAFLFDLVFIGAIS